jgi:hypothetical protein
VGLFQFLASLPAAGPAHKPQGALVTKEGFEGDKLKTAKEKFVKTLILSLSLLAEDPT